DNSGALRDALKRIRIEAENAVRGGAAHIVPGDEGMNAERAAIPMILATGAVHSHLVRQGLRTFTSLTVRSGACLDVHYFAVLIGVGATTVNAYLAEACLIDRVNRGMLGKLTAEDRKSTGLNSSHVKISYAVFCLKTK